MTLARAEEEGKAAAPAASGLRLFSQLLHGLNQPLTGLQCSLELALCGPRTPEQYVDCIRGGLELTERMRNLAGAMRELVEVEEVRGEGRAEVNLKPLLEEALSDLQPLAEAKQIKIAREGGCPTVHGEPRALAFGIFQVLESALSLAAPQSVLSIGGRIEAGSARLEIGWSQADATPPATGFSAPELGLVLAQARLERGGARWRREKTENRQSIALHIALFAGADFEDAERKTPSATLTAETIPCKVLSGQSTARLNGKELPPGRNS